ncbi:MAG TPA: RsbRD N-terminal domain-containing protein [Thermoguttaceae bacterium]|nr:RsbRD N-terminal domain-containing protein [Thermoguttaceae bacterium]
MMTLEDWLRENEEAVVRRWLEGVLATYGDDASALFRREKNAFANPVGHNLRKGTRGIFEALLAGMDSEKIRQHVYEIVKVRAVQEFSASGAVGFVFPLKEAIRAELGKAAEDPKFASELTEIERNIDRIALVAFDVFVQCREQVYELRANELRRRVSWIVEKINQRDPDPELARIELE